MEGLNQALLGSLLHHESGRKIGSSIELSGSLVPLDSVGPLLGKTCPLINKQVSKELILDFLKWAGFSSGNVPLI